MDEVEPERLMSLREVAEVLGVPEKTMWKWRYRQPPEGPSGFRVGKHIKYRPSEVQRWIEQQEREHAYLNKEEK